jgi:hypothetical protein
MGEPCSVVVPSFACEYLHFSREASECGAMDNPIAIALKRATISVYGFRVLSPPRILTLHRIGGQQQGLALGKS